MNSYITPTISEINLQNNLVQMQATGEPPENGNAPLPLIQCEGPSDCSEELLAECSKFTYSIEFIIPSGTCDEESIASNCVITIGGEIADEELCSGERSYEIVNN